MYHRSGTKEIDMGKCNNIAIVDVFAKPLMRERNYALLCTGDISGKCALRIEGENKQGRRTSTKKPSRTLPRLVTISLVSSNFQRKVGKCVHLNMQSVQITIGSLHP